MKKVLLIWTLILQWTITFAQTDIVVTQQPKIVPEGKKWVLQTNKETKIEISRSTLISGNLCNARFLSNPGIVTVILEGDYGTPKEGYALLFSTFEKESYTNEYTYKLIPKSILDSKFNLSELNSKSLDQIGQQELTFYSGTKVYVTECLVSIKFVQYDLTKSELEKTKKEKEELIRKENEGKRQEEEVRIAEEKAKNERLKNMSLFFSSHDLSNKEELALTISDNAALTVYNYIKYFEKEYPDAYKYKVDVYNRNVETDGKPDEYSLLDLNTLFDENAQLKEIEAKNVLITGQGMKDIKIPDEFTAKLRNDIKLNKSAIVKVDNQENKVKSKFTVYCNYNEQVKKEIIEVTKTKNGDMKLPDNYSLDSSVIEELTKMLNDYQKGKYKVNLLRTNISLTLTHFQNHESKTLKKWELTTVESIE